MKKSEVEALFDHWAAHERPLELFNAWDAFVATDFVCWALDRGHLSPGPVSPNSVKEVTSCDR